MRMCYLDTGVGLDPLPPLSHKFVLLLPLLSPALTSILLHSFVCGIPEILSAKLSADLLHSFLRYLSFFC